MATINLLVFVLTLINSGVLVIGRPGVKGWYDQVSNDVLDYNVEEYPLPDYPDYYKYKNSNDSGILEEDTVDANEYGGNDVRYNVDPYYPDIVDLGKDIQPVYGEKDKSSEETFDWGGLFSSIGDTVSDKFDDWTNKTKEGFGTFAEKTVDVVGKIDDSFDDFKDDMKDKAYSAGAVIASITSEAKDHLSQAWQSTKETVPQVWENLKKVLVNFGYEVEEGATYIKEKCEQLLDEARGSHILHTLEQKLEEGDENVAAFFTTIGKKISEWSTKYTKDRSEEDMDDGLLVHDDVHGQHFTDPGYPNILQEQDVHNQLVRLVNHGVLDKQDVESLYQTSASQGMENEVLLKNWDDFKFDQNIDQIVQETNH